MSLNAISRSVCVCTFLKFYIHNSCSKWPSVNNLTMISFCWTTWLQIRQVKGWLFRPISDRLYHKAGVGSHPTGTERSSDPTVPLIPVFFLSLISMRHKNPHLSTNRCLKSRRGGEVGRFVGFPMQKTAIPTCGKSKVWAERGAEPEPGPRLYTG